MKKITLYLMTACLSLTFLPLLSIAGTPASSGLVDTKTTASVEANALLLRLNEINTMDKSNLTSSDRKALRIEVRSIRHELKNSNGGIYLSVGAIIIIILLLILLL